MLKKVIKQFSTVSLILLGVITWSITMLKSGYLYNFGLGFWGPNGHDGVWHIAVANSFANFSFLNPVYSGEILKNYHFGFDLLLAGLNIVSKITVNNLYFQVLPPLFALTIGILTYKFVSDWTKSKNSALLSTFFIYFGGSAAWILNKGESAFWSQQAISTLTNPPFALSLIFILLGLISIQNKKIILSIIFFGLLIQIKVYAGLLILGGLFVSGIYDYLFNKNITILKSFFGSLFISLLIFIPFNRSPQSLISFNPFWFLETMMSYSDRIGYSKFYSAMTTYRMGHIWIKGFTAYTLAFAIFIFGNFWTRLIFIKDIFKNFNSIKILLLSVVFAGILIPMIFVQEGTPWNTIQFTYYSLFFSGILAGITLNTSPYRKFLVILLVLLTIPTSYITLKDVYVPNRPPAMLNNGEIEALNFLRQEPYGIILTYPYDSDKAKEAINNPPRPLYLYESTAYVSAYSNKPSFLEDEVNLNIMGYDWKNRRVIVNLWYFEKDQKQARNFLSSNNIQYIYWVKPQRALLGESQLGLEKIFENKEVIIYRYGQNLSNH